MDLLIKICLAGGAIMVGSALLYLAGRLLSTAILKSYYEFLQRRKENESDAKNDRKPTE